MGEVPGKDMPGESLIKEWQKATGDQELRNREMLSDMQQKEETGSMARVGKNGGCPCVRSVAVVGAFYYGNGWEDFRRENAFAAAGSISDVDGQAFSAGEKDLAAGGQCVSREEEDKIVREVLKEFLA